MRAVVGSLLALAGATALVYALRPIAPTLSLGVVYTPAVLVTAVLFGIGFALGVAVASMLAFNVLFLAPVGTLTLADARNWTALAVYAVTAVVAGELAARARRRAADAEQREREAALLSDVAAELLQIGEAPDLRGRAERALRDADPSARARFEAALDALQAVARERDRLEGEAREAEALRRSDAIKTTILQAVSHDFRTPLATMSAAIGGLQSGELELTPHDRAELLDSVAVELGRLTRLVENLLDLSRLQAGAARPRRELWSADDLLAEIAGSERVRVDIADGLPAVRVDLAQVQRILANLVDNALRFSAGEVAVRVAAAGEDVAVEVLDRGPGPAAGAPAGAGLGLSIARGFAAVNGASLVHEPRGGGGTCARLTLPAERVPAPVA
jgi:two-component system sensor histidine kinase KdpD